MNPGPWGTAQTGVPFGEVTAVRDWMGIEASIERPKKTHPKRPVDGFQCKRREVSGKRLWGWAKKRFGTAENFFSRFFVTTYCPLMFIDGSGRNRTPDNIRASEKKPLLSLAFARMPRAPVLRSSATAEGEEARGGSAFAKDFVPTGMATGDRGVAHRAKPGWLRRSSVWLCHRCPARKRGVLHSAIRPCVKRSPISIHAMWWASGGLPQAG